MRLFFRTQVPVGRVSLFYIRAQAYIILTENDHTPMDKNLVKVKKITLQQRSNGHFSNVIFLTLNKFCPLGCIRYQPLKCQKFGRELKINQWVKKKAESTNQKCANEGSVFKSAKRSWQLFC